MGCFRYLIVQSLENVESYYQWELWGSLRFPVWTKRPRAFVAETKCAVVKLQNLIHISSCFHTVVCQRQMYCILQGGTAKKEHNYLCHIYLMCHFHCMISVYCKKYLCVIADDSKVYKWCECIHFF